MGSFIFLPVVKAGQGRVRKETSDLRITISGRHVTITDAIRDYAREKVERLEKYFHGITTAQAKLSVEGVQHSAEIILMAAGGATIIGSASSNDMYSAIDIVLEKVERQLKKHKDKLQGRRTGKAKGAVAP